jgi:quercetin dioxygenase-like cupin family protein
VPALAEIFNLTSGARFCERYGTVARWTFERRNTMAKQAMTIKQGEGEMLNVMGAKLRLLCPGDRTERKWSLMEAVLPPGAGPTPHDHPWDEAYFVLAGEVRFEIAGNSQLVKAGDFIYAPGGTLHAFQGTSADPARLLIFDAPAHSEQFFRDLDEQVESMPRDLPKALDIGARHQVRFQPPA